MKKSSSIPDSQGQCYFCKSGIDVIDYKDVNLLKKFTSSYAKIYPRRKSNVCAKHQRSLAEAIKRSRTMALLAFVVR